MTAEPRTPSTLTFSCSQVLFTVNGALVQGTLMSDTTLPAYTIQFMMPWIEGQPFTSFAPGHQYDTLFTEVTQP